MKRRLFLKSLGALGVSTCIPRDFAGRNLPPLDLPSEPLNLLRSLVEAAMKQGAAYADARFVHQHHEALQARRDQLYSATYSEFAGIAIRVYKNDNWGFAASSRFASLDPKALAQSACNMASALGKIQRIPFNEEGRLKNTSVAWSSPVARDPFSVPFREKADFLLELSSIPLRNETVAYAVANLFSSKRRVFFFSSLDAAIDQTFITTYPNFGITAFDNTTRTIASRTSSNEPRNIGFEIAAEHPFKQELERSVEEVREALKAPPAITGEYDLLMEPSHLCRILYETLAPHIDSYTILGFDGGNPLYRLFSANDIGKRVFESQHLNLRFDNTLKGGLAGCGWDDSGRQAAKGTIIEKGNLIGVPGSDEFMQENASWIGHSTRAAGWQGEPRFAMPNLVLDPSPHGKSLEEMIASTEKGILLTGRGRTTVSTNRKWFHAESQLAWLIENGKKKHMIRDLEYDTSVLYFWNVLSETGGARDVLMGGDMFPQNNNPLWELPFSVSTPPARFAKIPVFSTREGGAK